MKIISIILGNLKGKSREEKLTEITDELVKSITQTVLDNERFNSVEMATIANNILDGVRSFLSARKERLTEDLKNAEDALKTL